MNDAIIFAGVNFIITAVINVIFWRRGSFKSINKSLIFPVILFTLLYVVQCNPLAICSANVLSKIPKPLSLILIIILIAPSFMGSMYLLLNRILYNTPLKEKSFFPVWLCKLAVVVETIFFIGSTYPAIFVYGDTGQIMGFINTNTWDAWHTLGYLWFVEILSHIYPAPYSVVVCQAIIWVILNFYIIDSLKNLLPRAVSYYTIIMCGLFTPALYLETMSKDTVFSMGILSLSAVAFIVTRSSKIKVTDILVWAVIPLFALLCRYGGAAPVIVTDVLILIFAIARKNKKLTATSISITAWHIFAYILVTVILANALNTIPQPKCLKYATPMATIGAAVSQGVEFKPEEVDTLEKLMPLEEWCNNYNPYSSDDLTKPWGKLGDSGYYELLKLVDNEDFGKELIKINLRLFLNHPVIYARAIFRMNSIMWEYATPADDNNLMTLCEVPQTVEITYTWLFKFTRNTTIILDHNPYTRAFFSRSGVSTFVILLTLFVALKRKETRFEFIAVTPIVIVMLLLSISIPVQDPRYILPAIETAAFFLALLLSGGYSKQIKEKQDA